MTIFRRACKASQPQVKVADETTRNPRLKAFVLSEKDAFILKEVEPHEAINALNELGPRKQIILP